jgi:hypothetical protein
MKKYIFAFGFLAMAAVIGCRSALCREEGMIRCDGEYTKHLQGVATDGESLYWSFTDIIVRTDRGGKILATQRAPSHQGDLCFKGGVVYVAVNRGRFNQENRAVSEVSSYDAKTLKPLKTWPLKDMPHGAGGMTSKGERFFVVGGLPATHECNYVYEYTGDFKLVKRHELKTGFTLMGIQTAAFEDGHFFFGIYGGKGNPSGVLKVAPDFSGCERFTGTGSVGIIKLGGRFFTGKAFRKGKTKVQLGAVLPDDDFCTASRRYVPEKNGGELRVFFAKRDAGRFVDCGYNLRPDGYRPLTRYHQVFQPVATPASGADGTPAVCIDAQHTYSIPDLVRGVRRAAEQNESLAICLPGCPETICADKKMSEVLAAVLGEAEKLGVKIVK